MIKNATYAGYIQDCHTNFELKDGKHDGIISKATFDMNLKLLFGEKNRNEQVHLKKNELYVLKGTLRCPECDKLLYASAPRTGNGGHSPRYHCGKCQQRSIPAKLVHEDFQDLLQRIKPTEGMLRLYKEVFIREANHHLGRINKEVELLRSELNDVPNKKINRIEKFTIGNLTQKKKKKFFKKI